MKNTLDFSLSSNEGEGPSASLQDIAAYLRGVADATEAIRNARAHVSEPSAKPSHEAAERASAAARQGPSSRRTVPYGVETSSISAERRDTISYPLHGHQPAPTPELVERILEVWEEEEEVTPERASGVCLRADRLPAEWYELVGVDVA
jgi:hypothetical protein